MPHDQLRDKSINSPSLSCIIRTMPNQTINSGISGNHMRGGATILMTVVSTRNGKKARQRMIRHAHIKPGLALTP
jgi:hypothetical protein